MDYLGDPGKFITQSTDNHRETAFLFHQLLVLIHCNTVVILGSLHLPIFPTLYIEVQKVSHSQIINKSC